MVDAVLIVAAGLVVCSLVVSAFVESAGKTRSRRLSQHAPGASEQEPGEQWTRKRKRPESAGPARVKRRRGYYRCGGCKSATEVPHYFRVKEDGYWLEVVLCCECWPVAARNGYNVFVDSKTLAGMWEEIEQERLTDAN